MEYKKGIALNLLEEYNKKNKHKMEPIPIIQIIGGIMTKVLYDWQVDKIRSCLCQVMFQIHILVG